MEILKYVGLVLFAVPFVLSGIAHFRFSNTMAGYAQFKQVKFPLTSVLVSGAVLFAAPLLVIVGVIPQIALGILALVLLGAAFKMHDFWTIEDSASKQTEQINFNKNIGLAGAAIALLALL